MKKRIKLAQRVLPNYTHGEEVMNTVTHIVGGALGIVTLLVCVLLSTGKENTWSVVSSAIYGGSMIVLYTMSSVYHGLRPGTGKKVMQILDHCTIYLLIAGTYTPIVLVGLRPYAPVLAWGLFAFEWGLGFLAATLTAIDLEKYDIFSMACYILMGWAVLPFGGKVTEYVGRGAFQLLLVGGIAFSIGAVLYGIGSKKQWMHSVFHVFVVLGTVLQSLAIMFYVL